MTPPPADTPPFPDEHDLTAAWEHLESAADLAASKGHDFDAKWLRQRAASIRAHAATLAAAQGTARQLERMEFERPERHLSACRKVMYDIKSSPCTCQSEFDRVATECEMWHRTAEQSEAKYAALREQAHSSLLALEQQEAFEQHLKRCSICGAFREDYPHLCYAGQALATDAKRLRASTLTSLRAVLQGTGPTK